MAVATLDVRVLAQRDTVPRGLEGRWAREGAAVNGVELHFKGELHRHVDAHRRRAPAAAAATIAEWTEDGDETDVDCGGSMREVHGWEGLRRRR